MIADAVGLMKGKVALVTGANCGIGKETAAVLAERGALTVLACRDTDKAEQAAIQLRDLTGNNQVETISVDLKDLQSVARCVDELLDRFATIDVLVNNAGGYWDVRETTPQGFEQHFAVNYLSHYLLTRRLLDACGGAAPSRVVNVTSVGHRAVKCMNWDDLQFERGWNVGRAYGQSKLALILFTHEIARRFGDLGVIAHAAHPGFVKSNFAEDGDTHGVQRLTVRLMTLFGVTPAVGAKTSVHLATSQEAGLSNGGYWVRSTSRAPSRAARDGDAARRLWDVSQRLLIEAGVAP